MKSIFRTFLLLGFLLLGAFQTSYAQTIFMSKIEKKAHCQN
jgi:hypothetical protein